jgi:hypothetical protein
MTAPRERRHDVLGLLGAFVVRVWRSPTIMTWGSFLTRSLSIVVVLPLILTRLSAEEVAVWYLFRSFITLQLQADLGFSPTFTRVIAFALGGLDDTQLRDLRKPAPVPEGTEPNWQAVERICGTMRVIYARLTGLATLLLLTVGTLTVARPIGFLLAPSTGWIAWGLVVAASVVILRGHMYSAYLQGLNRVALVRRWEALMNAGMIGTTILVLLLGGGLLGLVAAHQGWMVLNVARNWALARHVVGGRFRKFTDRRVHRRIMEAVWPSAWRSGLGTLIGQAPVQFTGMVYAQIGDAGRVAVYLFSMHLLTAIRNFSMAPFYSKIPKLARRRARAELQELIRVSMRGMRLAHWTYVVLFVGAGLSAETIIRLIGSNVDFVPGLLWALFGAAAFVERYGAMHLQLYSTTNHIVWHIANGVTGTVFAVIAAVLFPALDWYGFAVAYLAAYLAFYAPYAARLSYESMKMTFLGFERSVVLGPAAVVVAYVVTVTAMSW